MFAGTAERLPTTADRSRLVLAAKARKGGLRHGREAAVDEKPRRAWFVTIPMSMRTSEMVMLRRIYIAHYHVQRYACLQIGNKYCVKYTGHRLPFYTKNRAPRKAMSFR